MTPCIDNLVNEKVIVETDTVTVEGTLVYYDPSVKSAHKPYTLLLQTEDRRVIVVRGWGVIKKSLSIHV